MHKWNVGLTFDSEFPEDKIIEKLSLMLQGPGFQNTKISVEPAGDDSELITFELGDWIMGEKDLKKIIQGTIIEEREKAIFIDVHGVGKHWFPKKQITRK